MNFGPCPGTECVWDVNGDGVVDESDVVAVTSSSGGEPYSGYSAVPVVSVA